MEEKELEDLRAEVWADHEEFWERVSYGKPLFRAMYALRLKNRTGAAPSWAGVSWQNRPKLIEEPVLRQEWRKKIK